MSSAKCCSFRLGLNVLTWTNIGLSSLMAPSVTWTNDNLSLRHGDIYLSVISLQIPQPSIIKVALKITYGKIH